MDQVWFVAAIWLLLALIAVLVAHWLKVSTALSEIMVGVVAQLAIVSLAGGEALGAKARPDQMSVEFSLNFEVKGKAALIPVFVTGETGAQTGLKVTALWKNRREGQDSKDK